jgi:hypothetical protein
MAVDVTRLLEKLNPRGQVGGDPGLQLRTGVIDALNADGTADVDLNGVIVPDVPVLNGAVIADGSVVQMLGYRASLLILGLVAEGSLFTPAVVSDGTNTATFSNTSPAATSPAASLVFVAPASGSVLMTIHASLTGTGGQAFVSGIIRAGGTPGSGTVVYDGSAEPEPRLGISGNTINGSIVCLATGLTPGNTYNAQVVNWIQSPASSGQIFSRHMMIRPA